MSSPKLHQYVPRFYLKQFSDENDHFWAWNKNTKQVFKGNPYSVAAEKHFYPVPELIGTEHDPLFLERNLSELEGASALIMNSWIDSLESIQPMDELPANATILGQKVRNTHENELSRLTNYEPIAFNHNPSPRELTAISWRRWHRGC